jgi:4-hydroxy-tetrahydrodipicolinate reductase
MGRAVCQAVEDDPDLDLVVAVDPSWAGEPLGHPSLVGQASVEAMAEAGAQVAVDFTVAEAALANAMWCADHGIHAVVGTTGLQPRDVDSLRQRFEASSANCVLAPNFAIGAILMMRFAELAAPWFETVEIIELHHDGKRDAPSGTSVLTATRIAAARAGREMGQDDGQGTASPAEGRDQPQARGQEAAPGVRVHSVRLRGLVAHQEVIFGTAGETLTVRHDSLDRASFMPGVVLAVKQVPEARGFTLGLDSLLGL